MIPDFYNDLDATFAHAWHLWVRGGKDRRSAFHTPVVATITPDGAPQARVMVLRQADMARRSLRFHTDTRSTKVAELGRNPAITVLGYDPGHKIQLRVRGRGIVDAASPEAEAAWDRTSLPSRKCYLADPAPGTPSPEPTSGLAPDWATRDPLEAESLAGRAQFAILLVEVVELEWVYLAASGHRRARFTWQDDSWEKTWLVP